MGSALRKNSIPPVIDFVNNQNSFPVSLNIVKLFWNVIWNGCQSSINNSAVFIPQKKTTHHVDDGGGHRLKVHGALALLADVGVGPHHGLVGVVEAEGHGVAAHVQPLQGLHPGLLRCARWPLHSHLQHNAINTLKSDFYSSLLNKCMQEILGVVLKKYCRCCVGEIQISGGAAVTARREIWGNIDRTPAAGGKLCSAPCVCGIRCAAFPGFQRHSTHARHSILPPTTQIYSSLWDALSKTSLLLLQNSNKILSKSIHTVMWKVGVDDIKSSFRSWKKKTKMPNLEILCAFFKSIYQPQL